MEHIEKLAIIGLVNLLVYYKTLFFGYVGDDVERSERKEPVFKNILHRWWIQFVGWRHTNSMVAHLITIITHTVCCMMIYLALGRNNVAFLTALLFSVNPVNIQGSIWISGRNYVTSSVLVLLMWMFPFLSWFFYLSTSYFAVNAWFAPLVFAGTKYWYMIGIMPLAWLINKENREVLHRKIWETGGLKTTNKEMRAIKPKKFVIFLKTYLYYFILAIFPWRIGIEHNFLRGFGTNKTDNWKGYKIDWLFWLGLTLFLSVNIASFYCILHHNWNPIIWGLFWFTVNIAMWCNFITIQQQVAERYIYLANIGIMFALANLIIAYPIIIAIFLTAYLVRLFYVMDMYLNDYWAVEHSIMDCKKMHYMWLMRGVKKFMLRDYIGAVMDFNEAYMHKNYDLKVLYNLSITYFMLGDVIKAREFLEKARNNIYDEAEEVVKPAFDNFEGLLKQVEEARDRGEKEVQLNLNTLMVVKTLTILFPMLYLLYAI